MIDDRSSDGGFFFWGGGERNSATVQRLVNITGGGENFMYAHVVEHHPPWPCSPGSLSVFHFPPVIKNR